jgi:hypothetical protein
MKAFVPAFWIATVVGLAAASPDIHVWDKGGRAFFFPGKVPS